MLDPEAFPRRDPVGPADPSVVIPNIDVIADVVAPGAEQADAHGVLRSTIDALATAGLHGAPLDPPAAQRELAELLAGSDASTWFCWAQHQTPMRVLADDGDGPGRQALRSTLLPGLRSGALLAAVAFAHVRRPGPPNPVATRIPGGWRLEGSLDWVTSWDIADVAMVMAQGAGDDSGHLVCGYLPAGRSDGALTGVRPGEPLRLLAMSGTHTRPVRLDGVVVPDSRVGAVLDRAEWLAKDAETAASASPSAFGVARGAIAELESLAIQRGDGELLGLAKALVEECRVVRGRAYAAMDDGSLGERLLLRARSLDLVVRATTAAVVARAGSAMRSGHPAERRVREAMFLQVQAQTRAGRSAMVALMGSRATRA